MKTLARCAHRGFWLGLVLAMLSVVVRAQTSHGLAEVRIRGDVRRIQPMADGSFVLGGFTAFFNGVRDDQLIRVRPDGTRVAFPVTVGGSIQAMALSGQWLYLGGDFQVVNGVSCPFVARVNASSGAVDATWRPAPNGDILDLAVVPNGVVLSGSFSRLAGLPRQRLALVSADGPGRPVESWRCDANDQVDRVLFHQGWLYTAGRFTTLGGLQRQYLARVVPGSGTVDGAWNPVPTADVYDLAADGTHLYCAGAFSRIGLANTPTLARMPLNTVSADPSWAPQPDSLVARICISGDSVYASGNFTSISGLPQKYLARIPKSSGLADLNWRPAFDGGVLALVPDGVNGCWAGGRFDSGVGGGCGFAHFTKEQGTAAPTYPARVENVGAVTVIRPDPTTGGWLVGGNFDTVNGLSRRALFRLGPDRTVAVSWSGGLMGPYPAVEAMDVIGEQGEVLIGGQFEVNGLAGELLYNCLRLRLTSGAVVTTFRPQPDGKVYCIVRDGGTWLLGGEFNFLGPQLARHLTRIATDGRADPSFAPEPNGAVRVILRNGEETYLGGEFTGFVTGASVFPLPYLARLNLTSPDLAWQPRPNQAVFALAMEGNNLYVGGRFDRMARVRRRHLAQLPMGGAGTPTIWNPAPDQEVNALRIDRGNLYVGGAFVTIGDYVWPKLARFPLLALGEGLDINFLTTGDNGAVYAIEPLPSGELLVGGSFTGWDNDPNRRSLVAIGHPTGNAPEPKGLATVPEGTDETLADYFATSPTRAVGQVDPLPANEGPGLVWNERPGLPRGMVARVQWSEDLTTWRESGEPTPGGTWHVAIAADGQRRTARATRGAQESPPAGVFLRVVITPGEASSSRLLQ